MAATGSQEASSTWSSYHVFLSFRGKDTRTTFSDHLHTALLNAGICTFRDNDELERGDHIASELIKTMDESRISIIVFSKGYASSTWCLNEVLRMLERRRSVGHMIVPVFYHVDPSDLRWQKGTFGDSFARHEGRLKSESKSKEEEEKGMVNIGNWRKALEEVAGLSGHVLGKDEYESHFIQKIIKDIENKLGRRTVLSVCRHPIGLNSPIERINLWLQDESSKVSIMAIYGMGGIGKTTIAKTVYNLNFDKFEGSSFLAEIRETSKQQNGLVRLQRQLLSNILKGKVKINNVPEGNNRIKEALSSKRVLLVLDDVDRLDQLNAVLVMQDWIKKGSKIIITSRNEQLLDARKLNYWIHRVTELNDDESLQLFSCHAFGQYHPSEDYKEHSERVVKYCGGLPLALEVLGSSLSIRDPDIWEDAIKKLEAVPDSQIVEKLKISFDLLGDDCDQKIFLDIACFFVGKKKDFVITVLDACELHGKVGIDNLIKRCLLTVDGSNKLRMHPLLQEMGREIVRPPESPTDPWKGSRLWRREDALNVLREKNGTKVIEGLILNLPSSQGFSSSKMRRRLSISSWIPGTSAWTESSSTSNEVDLQTDAFSSMHNLRLLQLNNVRLTGNYVQFPKKLRWLCWHGFSLEIIPSEFSLESLVILEMKYSSLKQVWTTKKLFRSLKILDLSHSHGLTKTPDFSKVPNLESLILEDCINLIEVHESIGELKRLVLLNLKDCKNLRNLPTKIGQLKLLKNFILAGCSKLVELPKEMREMESLKDFNADGIAINQLPSTSNDIISRFFRLRKPSESILDCLPRSLVRLSLANCNLSDDAIPRDLGRLSLLEYLDISRNPICSLPESIKCLTRLYHLYLGECTKLQLLPELPMSLVKLYLNKCTKLQLLPELLPISLQELSLNKCTNLQLLPESIKCLPMLQNLVLQECTKLQLLPELLPMSLVKLSLNECTKLQLLPELLPMSLEDLSLNECTNLQLLPESIKCLTKLQYLDLRECTKLQLLPELLPMSLVQLSLKKCTKLQLLPESIKCLTMLQYLDLGECTKLQLLPELPMSLEVLVLNECRSLEIITNLPNRRKLELYSDGCKKVVEVKKLFGLEPIRNIDAEMIKNLELIELESMKEVEVILRNNLTNCYMIGPIQGLYEFGIFSIYLPGKEVPAWYSNKTTTANKIRFNVPSLPNNLKIRGLNVCVVNGYGFHSFSYELTMRNFKKTKDVKWIYDPTLEGFAHEGENMIWISHWKLGNQIEAGDEVDVTVQWHECEVKELGVHIVYEEEEEEKDTQHNTYTSFPDDVFDGAGLPSHVVTTSSVTYFCTYRDNDDDA